MMIQLIGKSLRLIAAIMAALTLSLFAQAERAEQSMLQVTLAVDGMMKSKSGAT